MIGPPSVSGCHHIYKLTLIPSTVCAERLRYLWHKHSICSCVAYLLLGYAKKSLTHFSCCEINIEQPVIQRLSIYKIFGDPTSKLPTTTNQKCFNLKWNLVDLTQNYLRDRRAATRKKFVRR
jgi:hypothetical protein